MTEADYPAELALFTEELNRAWRAAGGPSYAQLARLAEELPSQQRPGGVKFVALPRSTTSEILSGQRKRALRWPWVLTYVAALREAARQGGIDAATVGSIDEWRRRYDAVLAAKQARPRPVRVGRVRHGVSGRPGVRTQAEETAVVTVPDTDADADALPEALLTMVRRSVPQGRHSCRDIAPGWLEQYVAFESHAEVIRTYETTVIPTLLQTEAYARAVTTQRVPDATPDEIARLVKQSMQRQSLLGHQRPFRLWAVVEEAAFYNQQVDERVMRTQVEHLIDLAGNADIALQIMRASNAGNRTRREPMTIFRFPESFRGDLVFREEPGHAPFISKPKDTDHYTLLFFSLSDAASQPADAKQVLMTILGEI